MRAAPALHDEAEAVADRIVERRAAAGVDVVRAPALTTPTPPDTVAAATLRADEAFAALSFGDARRALDAAFALVDAGGATTRAELVALWLLAAMLDDAVDDDAHADEAARNALAIEPALAIDPARYPPTLSARVDALRATLPRCALALRLDPADAALQVDGDAVSAPPTELPCGTHWLEASRPGFAPLRRRVVLSAGAEPLVVPLALVIDPAAALATPTRAGEPVPALVERGASSLGRALTVLDLTRDADGSLHATLLERSVHLGARATPDEIASALLAPIDQGPDTAVIVGASVGVGVAVIAAIAIGVGVALSSSPPSSWNGVGEVIRP